MAIRDGNLAATRSNAATNDSLQWEISTPSYSTFAVDSLAEVENIKLPPLAEQFIGSPISMPHSPISRLHGGFRCLSAYPQQARDGLARAYVSILQQPQEMFALSTFRAVSWANCRI